MLCSMVLEFVLSSTIEACLFFLLFVCVEFCATCYTFNIDFRTVAFNYIKRKFCIYLILNQVCDFGRPFFYNMCSILLSDCL